LQAAALQQQARLTWLRIAGPGLTDITQLILTIS
jgi:hypothetical protein